MLLVIVGWPYLLLSLESCHEKQSSRQISLDVQQPTQLGSSIYKGQKYLVHRVKKMRVKKVSSKFRVFLQFSYSVELSSKASVVSVPDFVKGLSQLIVLVVLGTKSGDILFFYLVGPMKKRILSLHGSSTVPLRLANGFYMISGVFRS